MAGVLPLRTYAQQSHTIAEQEPNDSARTANAITLGDTVTGAIDHENDWDIFTLNLTAGTRLQLIIVDRSFNTTYGVGVLEQGTVSWKRMHDGDAARLDTLNYLVPASGRYYIGIASYQGAWSANYRYRMRIGAYVPPPPGPGDPVKQVVGNIGIPSGLAAGPSGEVYVVHSYSTGGPHLLRVAPNGTSTELASGIPSSGGLAIHPSGDLLISTFGSFESLKHGTVWRYTASQRVPFVIAPDLAEFSFQGIAVGPDGEVWFADPSGGTWSRLWRYDQQGVLKDTIHIDVGRVFELAFSPSGELHFPVQSGGVYKLVNGQPQLVIPAEPGSSAYGTGWDHLVFDRDGYLYAVRHATGAVVLFDPSYHMVSDPVSWVVDLPGWSTARAGFAMAFGRDPSGATTKQLLVSRTGEDPWSSNMSGAVYELNRTGIRAPGWPLGKQGGQTVTVSVADITSALLGGASLTAEQMQYLDSRGNHNGVLDVGDLRAYLRAQGQLPGSSHP